MSTHDTILIVDDEEDLRKVLDFNLRNSGFETLLAGTGQEALDLARAHHPDLILLDIMLPDMQGTQVCKELKTNTETRDIPVVMVSARGEEIDRVVGFELGADDYVTKPFSVREVILRVRAILKRVGPEEDEIVPEDKVDFGNLELDRARHRVRLSGAEVKLTATEFRLLETFLTRRGRVQTRDALLKDVWGEDINVTPRTVDTHVKRLREKLGDCGSYIETVRGVGYRFAESP
jgi:two-component system phosphate regulon response regulator PhoB